MSSHDTSGKRSNPINMADHMRSVQDSLSSFGGQWFSSADEFGRCGEAMGQVVNRILTQHLSHSHSLIGAIAAGQTAAVCAAGELTKRTTDLMQLNSKAMAEKIREMLCCRNMRELSSQQAILLRTAGECFEATSDELRDCGARMMIAALAPIAQALQDAYAEPDGLELNRQEARSRRAASER